MSQKLDVSYEAMLATMRTKLAIWVESVGRESAPGIAAALRDTLAAEVSLAQLRALKAPVTPTLPPVPPTG